MKKVLLALGLLFCALALGGNSSTKSVMAQEELTSLRGHVYGILVIPESEMAKIPEEIKNKRFAKERVVDFENGSREVRVGINGWTVSVGRYKVTTDAEGKFYFSKLPARESEIVVSFNKKRILRQMVNLYEGEENYQDIVVMNTLNQLTRMMGKGPGDEGDVHANTYLKCNDDTYWCWSFFGSDCYKNLFWGNPYCWNEHHGTGTRWCDGTKNCSSFMGHKQERHCDYLW